MSTISYRVDFMYNLSAVTPVANQKKNIAQVSSAVLVHFA